MLKYDDKLDLRTVDEGDRVTMDLNAHNFKKSGGCLTGTVTKMPSEGDIEWLYDSEKGRPMVDLTVEGDNGVVWTWNVDNGYVIGPVDDPDRPSRSDIGKFGGLYPPEARDDSDRAHDAGVDD